eukprot:6187572-Pleurochrysis_carterae.AAC.3
MTETMICETMRLREYVTATVRQSRRDRSKATKGAEVGKCAATKWRKGAAQGKKTTWPWRYWQTDSSSAQNRAGPG